MSLNLAMTQPIHIRPTGPKDTPALTQLAARTFRDAFAADNTPADMEAYLRDSFSHDRVLAELSDDANTFLLAFVDGAPEPTG